MAEEQEYLESNLNLYELPGCLNSLMLIVFKINKVTTVTIIIMNLDLQLPNIARFNL